jgi:hypothetical protein
MFGLLVTFSKIRAEAWYGKNTGLIESLPTGLGVCVATAQKVGLARSV